MKTIKIGKKEKYLIKATFPHLLSLAIHKVGLGPLIEKIYAIRQKEYIKFFNLHSLLKKYLCLVITQRL